MKQNNDTPERKRPGPKPKQLVATTILGKPVGRDKTVVPPDQVYDLAGIGCDDREIARFFGIKEDTLRYNFADELAKGREYVKIRLRQAMMKNATQHMNAAVQIFLAKNILGMTSEPANTENTAPLPWDATNNIKQGETNEHQESWDHNNETNQTGETQ